MAEEKHPFPSRTRPCPPPAPMILGGQPPGRVGRRRSTLTSSPLPHQGAAAFHFGNKTPTCLWPGFRLDIMDADVPKGWSLLPRWPLMAAMLAAASALVVGCTTAGAVVVDPSADPAVQQVDVSKAPSLNLAPRWERAFPAPAAVSVAPDGGVAVTAADGLHVFDAAGHELWTAQVDGPATALPQNLTVDGGSLYDVHGNVLWTDATGDGLRAVSTPDGAHIAVLDD